MSSMEDTEPKTGMTSTPDAADTYVPGWLRRKRMRQRVYLGILIFVVVAGLPMIAFPSLRARLHYRVQTLRAAALGEPPAPVPVYARIGEHSKPFPKEYEHPVTRASYLPPLELMKQAQPYVLQIGGGQATLPVISEGTAAPPAQVPAQAGIGQTPPGEDSEPQFRKGENEQAAYEILVNANKTLAGMIQGGDANLKFEDWSAAGMGQDSYYVMVTFIQTADNVVRKYIWDVKLESKEVRPLSAYAMSISK